MRRRLALIITGPVTLLAASGVSSAQPGDEGQPGLLRNTDTYVQVGPGQGVDALFYVVPGLADPDAVSITSIGLSGSYLRHAGNVITLALSDGSDEFAADATWRVAPGLADDTWISFESYNQPGMYMGRQFGVTALVAVTDTTPLAVLEDATFIEEPYQENVNP